LSQISTSFMCSQ